MVVYGTRSLSEFIQAAAEALAVGMVILKNVFIVQWKYIVIFLGEPDLGL